MSVGKSRHKQMNKEPLGRHVLKEEQVGMIEVQPGRNFKITITDFT